MKLSTKGRYGLRAVLDLALHSQDEVVPLSEIALRQNISISYLEQLISKLRRAGIVKSMRGAQGGYLLAKDPNKLSIGEILRALEGNLNPVDCAEAAGSGEICNAADQCVTKLVWMRISDSINSAVDSIMLSELIEESNKISLGDVNEEKIDQPFCGNQA